MYKSHCTCTISLFVFYMSTCDSSFLDSTTSDSPLVRKKTIVSPLSMDSAKHEKESLSNSSSPAPPTQCEEVCKNETCLTGNSPNKDLMTSSDNKVRFMEQEVCPINEDAVPKEKERAGWREKIFRGPKSAKKSVVKELTRSQEFEVEGGGKNIRPRSGRKHKYEDVQLKYVTSKDYEQEVAIPPPTISPTSFNRSKSLQVGMNQVGDDVATSSRHTQGRSTSIQVNDPPKFPQFLPKSNFEHNHVSPAKANFHTLTPVEEVPNDLSSSSSSHPHLVPTAIPHPGPPSGESDNEQEEIVRTLSVSHPVLQIQEEFSWDKTVDRRLYKKLNKAERERQAILHELIQTEKNHFRALHVLKLVFREQMCKIASEETIAQLFPELDTLIEISNSFLKGLKSKTDDIMIDDLSDVLLEQFTGESQNRMVNSFGMFCSVHLNATEIFKENMKKKSFSRLMKQLHAVKECQRLTLPDYYLGISQRLSKLLTLLKRLAKKSESLHLDHAPRVHKSLEKLEELITDVDRTVDDNKMKMEVEAIQSRLELPRSSKFKNRQERLKFSLTAQDRRLRKRGMAEWIGHGKQICECVYSV